MKKLILVGFSLIVFLSNQAQTTAQNPNNVPDPPYLVNPIIPPFRLLKVDSATYLTKSDIKKNHRVLIMFFSPECDHCKHQMKDILEDFSEFKDIEIIMATYQPFDEMKTFYNYYRLSEHSNIQMGRDEKFALPPFYRMQSLPYLALYDKKGNYITHFEGNQKVETILKAYQGKDK